MSFWVQGVRITVSGLFFRHENWCFRDGIWWNLGDLQLSLGHILDTLGLVQNRTRPQWYSSFSQITFTQKICSHHSPKKHMAENSHNFRCSPSLDKSHASLSSPERDVFTAVSTRPSRPAMQWKKNSWRWVCLKWWENNGKTGVDLDSIWINGNINDLIQLTNN